MHSLVQLHYAAAQSRRKREVRVNRPPKRRQHR
jgi:hypothetical protein